MTMERKERQPDVEALFEFNGVRKSFVKSGYRPGHLVTDDYVTTGVHFYYGTDTVDANGTATGTITFLTPECYPNCLWVGKKIEILEGARIVGHATIVEVYNPLLRKKE